MRLCAYQPDIAPNLGTMIRLCACFGVPLDIIEPCGFPLSIKSLRRSAMDYANQADLTRHDSWEDFTANRAPGRLILLTTRGETNLWNFTFAPNDILIMGRETAGVPDPIAAQCDARLFLPMSGTTRSLNVAVCAGIALGEGLRQLK